MICFGIIGEMFFRKANKINSICFSLLFILLYNPYYIYNVGFLFSYIITYFLIMNGKLINSYKKYATKTFNIVVREHNGAIVVTVPY